MKHSFKNPRYRICFQTRNKVWIYKNSRLRHFYRIRGKQVLKANRRWRRFLITKNMKWTVVRRQMVPYFRKIRKYSCFYKKIFFTKQQLKNFYGNLKEYELRNFFKQTWNKEQFQKVNIFLGALEQRLNVILFRMRLMPTIYSCTQLVKHHNILVNNQPINFLNYRVKLGDIVSISEKYWHIFYQFLFNRLRIRYLGEGYSIYRRFVAIKKIRYYFIKNKKFFYKNFNLIAIFRNCKLKCFLWKKELMFLYAFFQKNNITTTWLKILNWLFFCKITKTLQKIKKRFKHIRAWGKKKIYFKKIKYIWFGIRSVYFRLKKFKFFLQGLLYRFIFQLNILKKDYLKKKNFFWKFLWIWWKKNKKNSIKYVKQSLKNRRQSFPKMNSKYLIWLLRQFKYKRQKKNYFKQYRKTFQWYTPKYLEIDYLTLRASFVYYPNLHEVVFGFPCSFKRIVSFYKERAL